MAKKKAAAKKPTKPARRTKAKPATKKPAKRTAVATAAKKPAKQRSPAKTKPAKTKLAKSQPAKSPAEPVVLAPRSLHVPPLPRLEWSQTHWYCWYGTERLSSWAGLRFYSKFMKRSPKPDDGTVDIALATKAGEPNEPTASQIASYRYLKEHERALTDRVLAKILEIYPDEKRAYEESVDESWPKLPEITSVDGLSAVIGPPTIHVGDNRKQPGAPGEISFAFDCAWDEEHQLGVMTFDGEVIEIGDGGVAGHIRE